MKEFCMFAGYGGSLFALKKAEIEHECVGFSEIDKYAIQCFEQNFPGVKNYGDCRNINPNELPDFDLLTAGFPCQSFSIAGKGLGELDTRGTLFYDIIRIAEVKKPKYMLLENVKGLTNKNHKVTFDKILSELDRIGYVVKWKVLNSKEHGIPQNRERVFFVCFLKGIDTMKFSFPEKEELKMFLKDILEEEVDEKYYLSNEQIEKIRKRIGFKRLQDKNFSSTLLSRDWKDPKCVYISSLQEHNTIRDDGISNSLPSAMGMGVGHTPMIFDKSSKKLTEEFYWVNKENDTKRPSYLQFQNGNHSEAHRYYNPEGIMQTIKQIPLKIIEPKILDLYNKKIKDDGCCITLIEPHHNNLKLIDNDRIRKLTPKECFRLQGFLNDEINLDGLSDSQRYKLAGNGWEINLASKILKEMLN